MRSHVALSHGRTAAAVSVLLVACGVALSDSYPPMPEPTPPPDLAPMPTPVPPPVPATAPMPTPKATPLPPPVLPTGASTLPLPVPPPRPPSLTALPTPLPLPIPPALPTPTAKPAPPQPLAPLAATAPPTPKTPLPPPAPKQLPPPTVEVSSAQPPRPGPVAPAMPAPVAPCDIVPPPVPPPFQPPGVLLSLNPLAEPPPAVPIAATMPPASSDSHPQNLPPLQPGPLTQLPPLQPQPGTPGVPGAPGGPVLVWGPPGAPAGDGTSLDDSWRHGLRFESADGDFSLFVGGRTQFDVVGYLAPTGVRRTIPGLVPLEDGVAFRRARLMVGGTIYRNFDFLTEFDFVNGFATDATGTRLSNAPAPTDLWVQFNQLPWIGNVRVGNQKPRYSFEHLTSSRFLNFMERSLGFDAFVENFNNGFAPGVTAFDTYANRRGTWAVGLFKNTRNLFGWGVGRNEAEVNGRLTYLPVYRNDGRYLVHVGVGAAHRDLDDDLLRHRARLDARNSPSAFSPLVADTGLFFGARQQLLIPEFVVVAGPLSFQSEYYASWVGDVAAIGPGGVRGANRGTGYFQSAYGEVHYFLTGEHRPYDRDNGAFTRVVPRRPLAWNRCGFTGCGAWQVTARYSYLDLNDQGIVGGEIHDMTLGLNWFLNPNMKLQWNYFLAHRNALGTAADGYIQGFGMRTAIDF